MIAGQNYPYGSLAGIENTAKQFCKGIWEVVKFVGFFFAVLGSSFTLYARDGHSAANVEKIALTCQG